VTDTRETILSWLPVLLGGLPGIAQVFRPDLNAVGPSAWRNRGEITDETLFPAVVTLDGDEEIKTQITDRQRQIPGVYPPQVMTLKPQVFFIMKKRDRIDNLTLNDEADPIGPEISMWRNAAFLTVIRDPKLLGLIGNTGSILYLGSETDMKTGSTIGVMGAQLWLKFAISYVLDPSQLS
jgi:hypothetical protein